MTINKVIRLGWKVAGVIGFTVMFSSAVLAHQPTEENCVEVNNQMLEVVARAAVTGFGFNIEGHTVSIDPVKSDTTKTEVSFYVEGTLGGGVSVVINNCTLEVIEVLRNQ